MTDSANALSGPRQAGTRQLQQAGTVALSREDGDDYVV